MNSGVWGFRAGEERGVMQEWDEGAVKATGKGGHRPFVRFNRGSLIDRLRESDWDPSIMGSENQKYER